MKERKKKLKNINLLFWLVGGGGGGSGGGQLTPHFRFLLGFFEPNSPEKGGLNVGCVRIMRCNQ